MEGARCSLLLALCVALVPFTSARPEHELQKMFVQWAQKHARVYTHDEFFTRYANFKDSQAFIDKHNAGNHTFTVAMNHFGDMSLDEWRDRYLSGALPSPSSTLSSNNGNSNNNATVRTGVPRLTDAPTAFDWRNKGAVTAVRDQGGCGSGYAFAAAAALESAWAISTGNLFTLSSQSLIDCSGAYGTRGCQGGTPLNALQYVYNKQGLCAEQLYPYTGVQGQCADAGKDLVAKLSNLIRVPPHDEESMRQTVYNSVPLASAIKADTNEFRYYYTGVYWSYNCPPTPSNHYVEVVGYGFDVDGTTPFWWIKNSWGAQWGMQGYMQLYRGQNMCGIAESSIQIVV